MAGINGSNGVERGVVNRQPEMHITTIENTKNFLSALERSIIGALREGKTVADGVYSFGKEKYDVNNVLNTLRILRDNLSNVGTMLLGDIEQSNDSKLIKKEQGLENQTEALAAQLDNLITAIESPDEFYEVQVLDELGIEPDKISVQTAIPSFVDPREPLDGGVGVGVA